MKMMRSTSITSISGVMLMSDTASLCSGRKASWEWTIDFFLCPCGIGVSTRGTAGRGLSVVL